MDIRMPKMDGVQCTRIIKENYPQIKIFVLTTFDDDEYIYNALKYGASGYLLKGVSMDGVEEILQEDVEEDERVISRELLSRVIENGSITPKFTKYNDYIAVAENELNKIFEGDKSVDIILKTIQSAVK